MALFAKTLVTLYRRVVPTHPVYSASWANLQAPMESVLLLAVLGLLAKMTVAMLCCNILVVL